MKLIIFCGKKGSGKSTLANHLRFHILNQDTTKYPKIFSFASRLKELAAQALSVSVSNFLDLNFKEKHRKLLTTLADSYKEIHGNNAFANYTYEEILETERLCEDAHTNFIPIIDDARYPLEIIMSLNFKHLDVVLVHVIDPNEPESDEEVHSSENCNFEDLYQDFSKVVTFENDKTVSKEEFEEKLQTLFSTILAE